MSNSSTFTLASSQTSHPQQKSETNSLVASLPVVSLPPKACLTDSYAASLAEKGGHQGWDHYQEDVLPSKSLSKPLRNIRYIILNIYRRLFTVCFLVNAAILMWIAIKGGAETPYIGTIVVGNIFAAVLIRQDHVVNELFKIFTAVPQSAPLWVRTTFARVYSLGGIHSGSSMAATMWLFYFTVKVTQDLLGDKASPELVGLTYTILAMLCIIIALAMPAFRRLHHDSFEMIHRFLGWSATALLWAQTVLLIRDYKSPTVPLGAAILRAPAFWLVLILTLSITTSWLTLRKVSVRPTVLSNHALRLDFDYATPVPGSFTRISSSPLTEWHSFAIIAVPGRQGYSMIISKAGDWTSKAIAEPPNEVWVRGVPACGVMNIVPLFRRVLIVATGSGIAPCAPHVFAKRAEIKLLWTSRNIRKTYGDAFVDSILEAAPDAIIYDTDAHGRPDLVKLVHHVYKDFDAEAVCIIANEPITRKVVYGLMTRGVPAFGAIWDS
ncbi:hypothetical protein FRB90_004597 [Tulasnella sp. 427]|nr:hypothetical protein FRB90_004597 [Tulasnella sp. 427]